MFNKYDQLNIFASNQTDSLWWNLLPKSLKSESIFQTLLCPAAAAAGCIMCYHAVVDAVITDDVRNGSNNSLFFCKLETLKQLILISLAATAAVLLRLDSFTTQTS